MIAMRVVHVLAPAPAGGAEEVVRSLAATQADQGDDVHVVAVVTGPDHPFVTEWSVPGTTLHPLVLPGRAYVTERRRMADLFRSLEPAVVHTHGYRSDLVVAPVARAQGIRTVTTVHGFTGGGPRNRVYEWLQRRAFRRFDGVVAVSRRLHDDLIESGLSPGKVHLIPNAWAPPPGERLTRSAARAALGAPLEGPVAGWIGRLSPEKGPDVFIEALAELEPGIHAVIIGDGPAEAALRERARQRGLEERVTWAGRVSRAARLLPAFDLFVLSSRTEGTPMVLLEAMEAGVPIVATAVGGVPDVVGSDAGLLVPPEQPALLARAVRAALEDPDTTRQLAQRARQRLDDEYAVRPWADRYRAMYQYCR